MSVFSSLFKLIGAIVRKIVKAVVDFIKKYWWIIVIVALIYFAPAIGTYLLANGMTTLGTAFTTIGTSVTPLLVDGVAALWEGVSGAAGWAGKAFGALSLGEQAAIVTGAAALIAPEETADLLGEVADVLIDTAGSLLSALGIGPGVLIAVAAGLGLWWFMSKGKDDTVVMIQDRNDNKGLLA